MSTQGHIRVVTVSRQIGSNGEAIAREVANRLEFRYLDREVIVRASEEAGVTPELVADAEHLPSLKARMLRALSSSSEMMAASWLALAPPLPDAVYTSEHYRGLLEDVIREVAREGSAVILGHGAQIILRDRWDVLRVLVSASPQTRVMRLSEQMPDGEAEAARREMERSDAERAGYFERVYGAQWLSPALYDLCLGTDRWSVAEAASLVCAAARAR